MPTPQAPVRPTTTEALLQHAKLEHEALVNVFDRQGGQDHEAVKCLARAQIVMLEILTRLAK